MCLFKRFSIVVCRQYPLLGNRFLISNYWQPLLGNAFARHTLPRKRLAYNIERRSLRNPYRDVTTEKGFEARQSCKGVCEEKA
jgi:hypothetical protein